MTKPPVRLPILTCLAGVTALGGGCAVREYQPFASTDHLRSEYAERLGPERSSEIEVPYLLDDEVVEAVSARLKPSGSEVRRTNEILDFVFGWLDLEYRLTPTRDAVDTFHTGQGNCLSFVNLFVGIARHQRLNPFYVEVIDHQRWNYRDGVVVSQGHIVAGMMVDGEMSTYDFLPYRPKSYRNFKPIDDVMATAHFYNNLGAEALMAGDQERAEKLLSIAVELAPDFDKAINNYGVCLTRLGRLEEALDLYRRGLELDPANVALLNNLARAYQESGRQDDALALLDRLEETEQTSPYFFVYRGEMALAEGDNQQALEYLRKALRMDSRVPEVHVGLAKIYLAAGDLERARHHLQRALKLDATHQEARRMAVMLAPQRREPEGR